MDAKNLRILELLQENAKITTSAIAKQTGMPITTVYNRIRKMEEEGTIRNYTVNLNYERLGKPIAAYVLITVGDLHTEKGGQVLDLLMEKIRKLIPVEEACSMTGPYDFLIKVRAANIPELNRMINILRVIPQIDKTQTMITLYEIKQ